MGEAQGRLLAQQAAASGAKGPNPLEPQAADAAGETASSQNAAPSNDLAVGEGPTAAGSEGSQSLQGHDSGGPQGNGKTQEPLSESDILANLLGVLSQRENRSLPITQIMEKLPDRLKEAARDRDRIIRWLTKFPGLLEVEGSTGEERVVLVLGRKAANEDSGRPSSPARNNQASSAGEPRNPGFEGGSQAVSHDLREDEALNPATVQLRGLPFRATIADIKEFLGVHAEELAPSETNIRLLLNRDQRPSGFARVQFASSHAAAEAREALHKKKMGERYIEVLSCSDRDRKVRRSGPLRVVDGDGAFATSDAIAAIPTPQNPMSEAEEQARVLQECREHMRSQQAARQNVLLSMLGIALSPPARNYLRRLNLGLKHFLTRFPEFRVEGPKGVERVIWYSENANAPQLPVDFGSGCDDATMAALNTRASTESTQDSLQLVDIVRPLSQELFDEDIPKQLVLSSLPRSSLEVAPDDLEEPSTPQVTRAAGAHVQSAGAQSGEDPHLTTPSVWGTPGHGGLNLGLGAPGTAVNSHQTSQPLSFGSSSGAYANMAWQQGAWDDWWSQSQAWGMPPGVGGAQPNGSDGRHGKSSSSEASAARRSHAHLHPQSHPFARGRLPGTSQEGLGDVQFDGPPTSVPAVRLRGLPFDLTTQDVLAFFGHHDVAEGIADGPNVVHMLQKANGRPSGQAVVQMRSRTNAEEAFRALNNKTLGGRYIEVFVYGHGASDEVDHSMGGAPPGLNHLMPDMAAGGPLSDFGGGMLDWSMGSGMGPPMPGVPGVTSPPWAAWSPDMYNPAMMDPTRLADHLGGLMDPVMPGAGTGFPPDHPAFYDIWADKNVADGPSPSRVACGGELVPPDVGRDENVQTV